MYKFFLISFVFLVKATSIYACECVGDKECEYKKLGYRRCVLQFPVIEAPISEHSISSEIQYKQHDLNSYFRNINTKAEQLRHKLINGGVFGDKTSKEKQEKYNDIHKVNVAVFTFLFFSSNGEEIGRYYFHPNSTSDNITQPFFFFSGRKYDVEKSIETYDWDALPEWAIKKEDTRLLNEIEGLDFKLKSRESLKKIMGDNHIETITSIENIYKTTLRRQFFNIIKQENFFSFLEYRKTRIIKNEVCKTFFKTLLPTVVCKQENSKDKKYYFPMENNSTSETTEEGDFMHSEQFALYKMKENNNKRLKEFISYCVSNMGNNAKNIYTYALALYTTNTMCVRCSHSTVIDFMHTGSHKDEYEAFDTTINVVLKQVPEAKKTNKMMAFIAACRYPYYQINPTYELDEYEKHLRDKTIPKTIFNSCKIDESSSFIIPHYRLPNCESRLHIVFLNRYEHVKSHH